MHRVAVHAPRRHVAGSAHAPPGAACLASRWARLMNCPGLRGRLRLSCACWLALRALTIRKPTPCRPCVSRQAWLARGRLGVHGERAAVKARDVAYVCRPCVNLAPVSHVGRAGPSFGAARRPPTRPRRARDASVVGHAVKEKKQPGNFVSRARGASALWSARVTAHPRISRARSLLRPVLRRVRTPSFAHRVSAALKFVPSEAWPGLPLPLGPVGVAPPPDRRVHVQRPLAIHPLGLFHVSCSARRTRPSNVRTTLTLSRAQILHVLARRLACRRDGGSAGPIR